MKNTFFASSFASKVLPFLSTFALTLLQFESLFFRGKVHSLYSRYERKSNSSCAQSIIETVMRITMILNKKNMYFLSSLISKIILTQSRLHPLIPQKVKFLLPIVEPRYEAYERHVGILFDRKYLVPFSTNL